jgi:hypothetical protein
VLPIAGVLRSLPPRLEKFDRVTGRVVEEDLRTARPGHDVVSEMDPSRAESLNLSFAKSLSDLLAIIRHPRATAERRIRTGRPSFSERRPCTTPAASRWLIESEQATRGSVTRSRAEKTEEAELRGLADVAMVQAADFGKLPRSSLSRGAGST